MVSIVKCYLHNLFDPRRLIVGLELTNSEALFVDNMPLRVSIPNPTVEEIEQNLLKALECKWKQVKDRAEKKTEKDARSKKKAKATKCSHREPSETATQEGPLEPHSDRPVELLSSLSNLTVEIVGSERTAVETNKPRPHDHSVKIIIPVEEGKNGPKCQFFAR